MLCSGWVGLGLVWLSCAAFKPCWARLGHIVLSHVAFRLG